MSLIDNIQSVGPLADLYREQQQLEDYLRTLDQSSVLNNLPSPAMPAGPPPLSLGERTGMALSAVPQYVPRRHGSNAAGMALEGFARGFGQQTNYEIARRDREAQREQDQAAAANRARIAASLAHRAEVAAEIRDVKKLLREKMLEAPKAAAETPEARIVRIRAEAKAAAQGRAEGSPPRGTAPRRSTQAEKQALAFYQRMQGAVDAVAATDEKGRSLEDKIVSQNLAQQAVGKNAPNWLKTSDQQTYRQAQEGFITALLRRESGAAISAGEFDKYAKQYFAQPGDQPAVLAAKQKARKTALDGLRFGAGPAYDEFYKGEPSGPSGDAPEGFEWRDGELYWIGL